ncbi:hypothetical protein EAG_09119 [Camponotus floridanus]|uniref:Uncharacterized protein n=1 Tax=Camponotus floridanus TaxID=104421 RepID=E2AHC8_CAMFO|nr:hypothetical protein EAG_09119 [Camponotus floridanus]
MKRTTIFPKIESGVDTRGTPDSHVDRTGARGEMKTSVVEGRLQLHLETSKSNIANPSIPTYGLDSELGTRRSLQRKGANRQKSQ